MALPIVQTGHPVLRTVAQLLTREQILSVEIQSLIDEMRETMRAAPGVGLAAPQIGRSIQLVVIEDDAGLKTNMSQEALDARERVPVPFHVLVNPVLEAQGDETIDFFEGCLSVNGYAALTSRHRAVKVTALNEFGEEFTTHASGWYARILQHEVDHLNGLLYIDRMKTTTFTTMSNKAQYWD